MHSIMAFRELLFLGAAIIGLIYWGHRARWW